MNEVKYIVIIVAESFEKSVVKMLLSKGIGFFNVMYGFSSVRNNALLESLGFAIEHSKAIITTIVKKERVDTILEALSNECNFMKNNTGFAFSVPIDYIMV
jgi:hypothetical protein